MGQEEPSCSGEVEVLESHFDWNPNPNQALVISHSEETVDAKDDEREKGAAVEEKVGVVDTACKGLPRSESEREDCRVCQQQAEEPLIDLGCGCRGELSKAHKSCIVKWFHTRGSNKCEICQKLAVNVPFPDSQSSANYCVWRVESAYGATNVGQVVRARGCITPLWIAFAVLIGGLLLDVLLSILLGVSALPVNIIIGNLGFIWPRLWQQILLTTYKSHTAVGLFGSESAIRESVLIVLGLGTAFRLALECCHEWGTRRRAQGVAADIATAFRAGGAFQAIPSFILFR